MDIFLPFRITWSYCIRLSFLLRLLFGSFSNDFRHFTLSLTVLLYLFWHSRFDQSFVLSPIAMTFVIDPRNPHWAMPNVPKVLKTHVDRYNKVKNKNTIQSEQFPNLIGNPINRGKVDSTNTHIYDHSIRVAWLNCVTLNGPKLLEVYWRQQAIYINSS